MLKKKRSLLNIAYTLGIAAIGACTPGPPEPPAPAAAREYRVVGVVRRVEAEGGEVVLKHEAIPGYMAAMTMPFEVADPSILEDVRPGDEVEGTLRVAGDDARLVDLAVTRPATAEQAGLARPAGFPPPFRPLEPGDPVPDFAVTTQDGATLRLSDLRGKAVVLTFVYTRCPLPTACPLIDRKFAELADLVRSVPGWSDRVRLLSVSFDPEHDTPEALARHARLKGARPPLWTYAVASHPELAKVGPPLGLGVGPAAGGEIVHTLRTALIAPDGTLARLEPGGDWSPAGLLAAIRPLLDPSRK